MLRSVMNIFKILVVAVLYFSKGKSQYEEPSSGIFRPLVRDRRTFSLISSWPDYGIVKEKVQITKSGFSLYSGLFFFFTFS